MMVALMSAVCDHDLETYDSFLIEDKWPHTNPIINFANFALSFMHKHSYG